MSAPTPVRTLEQAFADAGAAIGLSICSPVYGPPNLMAAMVGSAIGAQVARAIEPTLIRKSTLLDVRAITGAELRVHPDDLRELREAYANCWPGNGPRNGPRNVWCGVLLVEDAAAERLPRVLL